MHRWIKHALALSFVSTLAACSSPSGCSGLDTFRPLPAGFPQDKRIENAASLRITSAGRTFLEQQLGPLAANFLGQQGLTDNGILQFPIPTTPVSGPLYNLQVCPDGPDTSTGSCVAEIDIATASLSIRTESPNDIVFEGSIPVRLTTLPITGTVALFPISVDVAISGGGNKDCTPATMSFATVEVTARLSLEVERDTSHTLRVGYSMLRIEQLEIDEQQFTDSLHACDEGLDAGALNTLKGALAPVLLSSFQDTMVATANQQLCIQADPAAASPCPAGTSEENGICVYADGACASVALGLEGHSDLGALLRSFSPGTTASLDLLLAGGGPNPRPNNPSATWGDLNPINGGATLGLLGGASPAPLTACVKPVNLELPTDIPIPDELHANTVDGWAGPGPHVGVAISERFVNYALGSAFNSGLFCIGVPAEQVAQLSAGLFLLMPSMKVLAHQKRNAPIALVVRPQAPPTVTLGGGTDLDTDPFVRLKLERAQFDFYVWSSDRFIRAFTVQFDLDVPINLDIAAAGITPVLEKIYVHNASVTNAALLREQPQKIAGALADLVEGLAGQLFGALQPFNVSDTLAPLGLTLNIPAAGVRRLEKNGDAYLGLFAGLDLAPTRTTQPTETTAEIARIDAPAEAFRLVTATSARPRVVLRAASSAARVHAPVEFTYRLDRGAWHPWTTSGELTITDPFLRMQGHHTVDIKSRIVGVPQSEDPSPARLHFTIDGDAPRVWLTPRDDGRLRLEAHDLVSPPEKLWFRSRTDQDPWSDWKRLRPRASLSPAAHAAQVSVEVRDENGNVATVQQQLVLARPDTSTASAGKGMPGCAMTSSPAGKTSGLALLGALAGFGLLGRRRTRNAPPRPRALRRAAAALAVTTIGGVWSGCTCTDDVDDVSNDSENQTPPNQEQCGTLGAPECVALLPGIIGSYTSIAVDDHGKVWLAGYNEADWNNEVSYGDLVVGQLDTSLQQLVWTSVDGVPSSPPPDETVYDLSSWRGGQETAGEDVGLWTSLLIGSGGQPQVAYYDATNAALKFAAYDGAKWTMHTVYGREDAEAGRYVKMVLSDGVPVVAFQVIDASTGGFATSRVVLGRASNPTPSSSNDWTFEDIAVENETPCRAHLCREGQACVAATLKCTQTADSCDPVCTNGQACIAGACETELDGAKVDSYPEAIGGYIALAAMPGKDVGLVFYDRVHGNLMQARKDGSAWAVRVLDGELDTTPPTDTGDMGIGASLFVDRDGDWHVAYVDGFKESLRYMLIQAGNVAHEPEVVDNGTLADGHAFDDGKHVVGDDANVYVSLNGEVRIAYQDATAGKLRYAIGTPALDGTHDWELRQLEQPGFAGFFPKHLVLGDDVHVINWWRTGGQSVEGNVRVLTP